MSEPCYKLLDEVIISPISGSRPAGGVHVDTEGVPSLGGENILSSGGVNLDSVKRIPSHYYELMPKGKLQDLDVLINKDGAQTGKVGLYEHIFSEAAINEHLFILRPKPESDLEPVFLYYSLLLPETQRKIERRITGSAQPGLNSQFVHSVDIPFFSREKQLKIAKILQTIDQNIEKTQALIEKYQQIKAGLMHDLFTRGATTDGKLRPTREQAPELYQETPIGWIPKDWVYDKFGANVSIIDPNPSHRYPPEVDDGYPICSTENFHGEDGFIFNKPKLVPEKTFQSQKNRCQFKENDVIFARKGKIGLARRHGKDKKVFSHTVVLMKSTTTTIDQKWLLWLCRSKWLLKAIDVTMNTNSGVPTLGVAFIKDISVPFPPINEQKRINESLEAISKKIRSEIDKKEKLLKAKVGLMQDLLSGKVKVQSDQREVANV